MLAIFHSVWTIVVLVIFLGIVAWAYSSKRNTEFDKASRMPMDDEAPSEDDSKNNSIDGNDNKNASDDNKNVSVDDTK